ncbi:MAG: hypothetical protein HRS50_01140 [Mycoplasmataceae bacterium]|nr:hypothetical protein [Mycoplasmataceae bacterium]
MNGNSWDFSDLKGKSEKGNNINKTIKEENKKVLQNKSLQIKNEATNNIESIYSLTKEIQLFIQTEVKKPITITLDESLIKIIDEKASKIQTKNNQGMRSKIINAALTKLFK